MNSTDLIRRALHMAFLLFASQLVIADPEKPTDAFRLALSVADPFHSGADSPAVGLTLDNGTLMVGHMHNHCLAGPSFLYGFASGVGSYSPTGLTGGATVDEIADITAGACVAANSILDITGFSSNPGGSWLISITCNGVKNLGSSATFAYSSGDANWDWTSPFGLSGKVGSNVSCTIDHN
jgi:hypothetical protein